MTKRKLGFSATVAFSLFFTFQNCSKSGFESFRQAGTTDLGSGAALPTNQFLKFQCTDSSSTGITDDHIRRLTHDELIATLNDLFGSDIVATSSSLQFYPTDNVSKAVTSFSEFIGSQHAEMFVKSILQISTSAVASRTALNRIAPTCLGTGIDTGAVTDACLTSLINTFGLRVQRRPVDASEVQRLLASFHSANINMSTLSLPDKVATVIAMLFQSPNFLFHTDIPKTADAPVGGRALIDGYSIASRLSYRLTGSTPDAELLRAAGAGELYDLNKVKSQAQRLLGSPAGRVAFRNLTYNWLRLDIVPIPNTVTLGHLRLGPDTAVASRLQKEYTKEILDFAEYVAFDLKGHYSDLLTSDLSFPRSVEMATILGVSSPIGTDGQPVHSPTHKGLMARPGLLATAALRESAIHRGLEVRQRIICDTFGPPPANADMVAAAATASVDNTHSTSRQISAYVTGSPSCISCHGVINSSGYAQAAYGPLGEFRTQEDIYDPTTDKLVNSVAIDASSTNFNLGVPQTSTSNLDDFISLMTETEKTKACMAQNIFRYSRMRIEQPTDNCQLSEIENYLSSDQTILDSLVANVTTSDILWKGRAQ